MTCPALSTFLTLPNLTLGLEELARKAVRKSHNDALVAFVVASSDCEEEDVFQLILVIRSDEDKVDSSIANLPNNGLRLCPLASHTRIPLPRAAANKSESFLVCGSNDKADTADVFREDA
jgi:hypothetical protein